MSRLHRVLGAPVDGAVDVADIDGARHRVSLLALDGPQPRPGDWLVVHSGYAIDRADRAEAEAVAAEIRAFTRGTRHGAGPQGEGP